MFGNAPGLARDQYADAVRDDEPSRASSLWGARPILRDEWPTMLFAAAVNVVALVSIVGHSPGCVLRFVLPLG